MTKEARKLPRHAAQRSTWIFAGCAVMLAVLGLLQVAAGAIVASVFMFAGAAFVAWFARRFHGQIIAVQAINSAVQEVGRGRVDEAEALLGMIPAYGRWGSIPRGEALTRGTIALQRGDVARAIADATRATDPNLGVFIRPYKRVQIGHAYALRALAHAADGQFEKALADVDACEKIPETSIESIARARTARAAVLSRSGRDGEVAELLAANATLLYEHTQPRDRALVRALARMTRARKRSVYREPSKPTERTEPGAVGGWIARIAPEAAAFADVEDARPRAERIDAEPVPPASEAEVRALQKVRQQTAQRPQRAKWTLVLWVVLIMMFLAVWQFLSPAERPTHGHAAPPPPPVEDASMFAFAFPALMLALFVVLLVWRVRQVRVGPKLAILSQARREAVFGDPAKAAQDVERLGWDKNPHIAANACLELARIAYRNGHFAIAIDRADTGIKRVYAGPARAQAVDNVLPALSSVMACAKAASGRLEEADAELAAMTREYPTFVALPNAQLCVRLVRAARMQDYASVAAIARERTTDLGLPRGEEMLGDLAIALASGASVDERERLQDELKDDRLRAWIDAVAPGLRDLALGAPRPAVRVAEAREREEEEEERVVDQAARAALRT
jgi:hypothetical protein